MGGAAVVSLRRSNREAAGLDGNETMSVTLALDTSERTIAAPKELAKALRARGVWKAWTELSFTHQREHVEAIEQAKRPETRTRRIAAAVEMVAARPPKKTSRARR
jgi:uncharacterized protein YdeI (YjbR/CyaY-like superfamily)